MIISLQSAAFQIKGHVVLPKNIWMQSDLMEKAVSLEYTATAKVMNLTLKKADLEKAISEA